MDLYILAVKDLSTREKSVLNLLGKGKRIKEIAHKLGISIKTVSVHKCHIAKKLGMPGATLVELYQYVQKENKL